MVITEEKVLDSLKVLMEQDQLVLLIQIVEKWSEKHPRTPKMSLLQGEAFCRLCLLDHAWQRVQSSNDNADRRALQVEILLQRGWVSKAQSALVALQTIAPKHSRLLEFHERARRGVKPPTQAQAQRIVKEGDGQQLLKLSQQCLCFGKQQVGRKILAHIIQKEPENPYVRRLLWAHKGDCTSSLGLHRLMQQVSPPEAQEVEYETTVAHTSDIIVNTPSSNKFPSLFRGGHESVTVAELTAEITTAFVFSDRGEEPTQRMDSFMDEDRATVALDVIQEDVPEESFEATGAFDKSMFMKESNDEEVVVLLNAESDTSDISFSPVRSTSTKEVEVVDKVPLPSVQREKRKTKDKAKEKQSSDARVVKGAIFAVIVIALLVVLALWGMRFAAAQNLNSRNTPIILSADAQQLNKLRTQLEIQVKKKVMPQSLYREYLALVYYVQWRDFSNLSEDAELAQMTLDKVSIKDRSWVGQITQSLMHLDMGQTSSALNILDAVSDVDQQLVQWVQIEAGLQSNGQVEWPGNVMQYPRIQILAIQYDAMVGNIESKNAWIQLTSLKQELGHIDIEVADAMLNELQIKRWTLGSAQQSSLMLLQSLFQQNQLSPKSRLLRKQAYEINKYNPDVQFWLGMDYFWLNQPEKALVLWDACFHIRSACASGYTFISEELNLTEGLLEKLEYLPSYHPLKESLIQYVLEPELSALRKVWSGTTFTEDSDIFWSQLGDHQNEWVVGVENEKSIWYLAWKAKCSLSTKEPKDAFRWAIKSVKSLPEYSKMYEILGQTASSVNKDPEPFLRKYRSLLR